MPDIISFASRIEAEFSAVQQNSQKLQAEYVEKLGQRKSGYTRLRPACSF
jgi:hypothetical protein